MPDVRVTGDIKSRDRAFIKERLDPLLQRRRGKLSGALLSEMFDACLLTRSYEAFMGEGYARSMLQCRADMEMGSLAHVGSWTELALKGPVQSHYPLQLDSGHAVLISMTHLPRQKRLQNVSDHPYFLEVPLPQL